MKHERARTSPCPRLYQMLIRTPPQAQENGGNIGIGFAVPINTIKELLPQLRKGSVQRGRLGVQILSTPITDDEVKQLGLPKAEGAIVSRVEPDSPAERAGLRPGDVIVEYNGRSVQDADRLTAMVVDTPAGTDVPLVLYRAGQRQNATARIDRLDLEHAGGKSDNGAAAASGLGLSLRNITRDAADELQLPSGVRGALVENVEPFTPAANAGLKRGDVILEVNRHAVASAADAQRELSAVKSGELVFLLLWRDGARQFVEVRRD
jgi:serine protease Do